MGFKTKNLGGARQRAARAEAQFKECLRGVMADTMAAAKEQGREIIQTSGTGRTWAYPSPSGRAGSYPGRVDTGQMLEDFTSEVRPEGGLVVKGAFGWLSTTEMYYIFQEYGFQHWITQEEIEGMQALIQTDETQWQDFSNGCDECVRKYLDAL